MWPQYILDHFSRIDPKFPDNDNCHFGVYLSILAHECFDDFQTFLIHPQYALPGAQDTYVFLGDYAVAFVVTVKDVPVFFLQVDEHEHCSAIEADRRMFDRIWCLKNHGLIKTPKLHGISAAGKKLAFYSLHVTSGDVTPPPPGLHKEYRPHIRDIEKGWDMYITTKGYE